MARKSSAMEKYLEASAFYLKEMETIGRSKITIRNYARSIELFRAFWEEAHAESHAALEDPGITDVQEWRDEMLRQGLKTTTVHQYMTELRIMFSFLCDETLGENRFYTTNPVSPRLIPDTKKETSRPYRQILTDDQAAKLWRNNRVGGPLYKWERNYAIIIFLLSTAIRSDELRSLKICDLDFENEEIVVESGKGQKYRAIDFPKIAQTATLLYIDSPHFPEGLTKNDLLFGADSSNFGGFRHEKTWKKGTSRWLERLVERHVREVTGVEGVSPHDLRHVGARLDLNNGMSLSELQAKLGHTNPKITQIYSGRLQPGKRRLKAKQVYAERDIQANRNEARIAISGGNTGGLFYGE